METKIILVCEESIDGIFTAVFEGFVIRNTRYGEGGINYRDNIEICFEEGYSQEMFAEYIFVETDYEKSAKTAYSIQKNIGYEAYRMVINALCHFDENRASIVFGFLVRGFKAGASVTEMLADRYVMRTMELSRKASKESHMFRGFLRFKDVGGTLYGVIVPKCNIIPLIGNHFSERYPNENWIIYDKKRKSAALHRKFDEWVLVSGEELNGEYLEEVYESEDEYTGLWKSFYDALYIKERKNERCQNNLIPKWYRMNMVEFRKD